MKLTYGPFSGERPRTADTMLDMSEAVLAQNTRLDKGDVRAWRAPSRTLALGSTTYKTLFQYTENSTVHWVTSASGLDWFRSPIAQDSYERIYYTGESEPRVLANDLVSSPFNAATDYYKWGVPAPTTQLTVGRSGAVTRYYIYTFANAYGEEGPPFEAAGGTDVAASPVPISGIESAPSGRQIDKMYLYRTADSDSEISEYEFVLEATWFSAAVNYVVGDFVIYGGALYKCTTQHDAAVWDAGDFTAGDDVADADLGEVCPSETWEPPPTGLKGVVLLPTGIAVGYVGNEIYFSEPYLPHAFPSGYAQSVSETIVGLGVFGNSVVVITDGYPYLCSGDAPENMTLTKYGNYFPGMAKRTIKSAENGVFYGSNVGVVRADLSGVENVSLQFMTKTEWDGFYPTSMIADYYDGKYMIFYEQGSAYGGIVLDFLNGKMFEFNFACQALYVSYDDANLYLIVDDETSTASPTTQVIKEWEGDDYNYLYYKWRSKKIVLSGYKNFSVARVTIDKTLYDTVIALEAANSALATDNASLFAASIAVITGNVNTFTGTVNDKIKVIIDGTTYDNINIGTCTTVALVATAINTVTGNSEASVASGGFLRIQGAYHVEIDDGSTTAQTVVADLFSVAGNRTNTAVSIGSSIGEDSLCDYGACETEISGVSNLSITDSVRFSLFEDEELKFSKTVTGNEIFTLPGGFRSEKPSVQVEGFVPVQKVEMSTSAIEMMTP